jgi:Dual-action HEIGH metallo-peptidase
VKKMMNQRIGLVLSGALLALSYFSSFGCTERPSPQPASAEHQEIVDNLVAAGFPIEDIAITGDRVYVGRDAHVTLAASREMLSAPSHADHAGHADHLDHADHAEQEQYRTTNLVSPSITKICVNGPAFTGAFGAALDLAIQNFDEQPLTFSMARAPSAGCSFTINAVIQSGGAGGQAGFPSGGLPYPTIIIFNGLSGYSVDTIEHVITHELGHTIGFRHSDYFNRSISCGSGGDEGDAGIGAIHVPGTPTGAAVGASLMNSCFRTAETGEFAAADVSALRTLYTPTQNQWRWCPKCQGLFYGGAGSACPAGGAHDGAQSGNYVLLHSVGSGPDHQDNWRFCSKCRGLFTAAFAAAACPAGGTHNGTTSGNYSLLHSVGSGPGLQDNWRWCNKCNGLFRPSPGSVCPAGGAHNGATSGNYSLLYQCSTPGC